MLISISTADGTPYYTQIVNQVRYLITTGRLEPGEQLPPVRKLAEQLTLNPNTVARAYRELEVANLVVSKRGAGVFVADGVSPLSKLEKKKIVHQRMDELLLCARQLGVDLESLIKLLRQRDKKL